MNFLKKLLGARGEKAKDFIKKYKLVLLIALAGVVLMLIPAGREGKKEANPVVEVKTVFSLEDYEVRLSQVLSSMKGVGKVRVMLTLKSGEETVYAIDENAAYSKIVLKGSGQGSEPVIVKVISPVFEGAVVVCEGGGSSLVAYRVTEAVSALTGMKSDKIRVVPMK